MAAITNQEKDYVRQRLRQADLTGTFLKADVNAALQAIEDTMVTNVIGNGHQNETVQQLVSAAIDAAGAYSFSAAQKKILFAHWAFIKFMRDK